MAHPLNDYAAGYQALRQAGAHGPAWLTRTRDEAMDRFVAMGFPTTRDEEWRFTSVAPIAETSFRRLDGFGGIGLPAGRPPFGGPDDLPAGAHAGAEVSLAAFTLPGIAGTELVFVDGHYAAALSIIDEEASGVWIGDLASALRTRARDVEPHLTRMAPVDRRPFTALNTAFLTDGACVMLPAHATLDRPVHLLFVSTAGGQPTVSHPRVLVVAGENSRCTIVESYAGCGDAVYFTNAVTEVLVGEGAVVDHYKLQRESVKAYHVGSMHVRAERKASFASHSIALGGALVRNDVAAVLDGEGAECTLNGLYVGTAARLVDNHTTIDHAKPHCGSRELYKGILAERARGVFNGRIIVRPDAQKTDARQTNRALLLSEDAQVNTKPELEIFANDVKCTHGAAVGQLDDEAVFYLRSRGLSMPQARQLLLHAFTAEVLGRMPREQIRARVDDVLQRRFAGMLAAAA